ncbi:uncharacterized protein OCT59_024055 [Rhizophagus irregularis]|uniref:Crinkler effector protein N-terminal domain-containing protein n=2 Tax=Rhizophagus irregularis TaxID=588596 RepID=A0A015JZV3_RHIIW|nr:hypothetical protein RirG_178400 [Rhizophagus irregularis DAOM 197198w]UZO03651.1 hypothetical protein OCT59_024055 [Rhizophagus irregularis]GBC22196.1 hypothetical protein GLOIN_2v1768376 [Rhizophagus irregularis DAOM 181602=DAOM 197198]
MMVSINCLCLGKTSFDDTFVVNIANDSDICGSLININNLRISDLKFLIWNKKKATLGINDSDIMDLWKVNIAYNDENKLKHVTTEDDIKKELGGKKLVPILLVKKLFLEQSLVDENIHVIVQLPTAAEPYWNDDSSVYEWIKQFKPNRGRNLLVKTYGKDFKFLQRDDTIKALWKGTVIAGIEARFKYRNVSDKGLHPIPILVGGPGVGKSRFLDEVERLLGQYANESDDEEIRKAFTNMTVINTTYGNGSPAGTMDVNFGAEASLAIRILYEYFRPNHNYGSLEFSHFQSHCYNYSNISSFTLSTALRIIYADVIIQKKQEINSNPLLVLVLGIDEFNKLHDTEKGICKELINAIGGVMCRPPPNIYFIPILAGTIEEHLYDYISGSMHEILPLPLRLLNDDDAIRIGMKMNLFDDKYVRLHPYFRISICDIGGHVRTLEYYYEYFAQKFAAEHKKLKTEKMSKEEKIETAVHNVNIKKIMEFVKQKIIDKYSLELNSHWLTIPLAKAILGFPVKKMDTIMLNKISMSYQELSSMGVVNLVPTEERGEYLIRLPYVWVCAIVESSDDHGMMYLKFMMLRYDEPWQNFEDFNAKFWALRLRLFHLIGYKQIKLKTLFKGADFSLSFPDVEVDLPKIIDIKLYRSLHRYPVTKTYKNNQVKYENMTEVRNGYIDLDLLKEGNIKRYIGCLFFNAPGEVNQELYDKTYEKVAEAMNKAEVKEWVLLFLTNANKENNLSIDNKPNSALVSMKNFQKFYGYTYASRAQFASANEKIYFNSAPVESLTILGFNEEERNNIRLKRKGHPGKA